MSTANDLTPEELAAYSDQLDKRIATAHLEEAYLRANPPRIVADDGTSRSVFDETLEARIAARPAPKVTPADIEAEIASEHYFTAADGVLGAQSDHQLLETPLPLGLLTFAVLVLRNGFVVTGESACASPENFDAQIGREVARKAAVQKLWPLLGFRLRDQLAAAEPERYVVPASLRASALDESKPAAGARWPVVEIEFNVIDNPNDFGYIVVAHGRRGEVEHTERETIRRIRPSQDMDEQRHYVTQAKQRAAERINAWFDTHGDDRQQDA